jgi:hypothetical protein
MEALDMVGVVGSSPIAPTKQNPLCWAVWKGSPKGGPFFVWALGNILEKRTTKFKSLGLH